MGVGASIPLIPATELRTTPALLGLFSLITVWADRLVHTQLGFVDSRTAAWYDKREPTFSDATVRRALWWPPHLCMSRETREMVEIHAAFLQRLMETLCRAT